MSEKFSSWTENPRQTINPFGNQMTEQGCLPLTVFLMRLHVHFARIFACKILYGNESLNHLSHLRDHLLDTIFYSQVTVKFCGPL